MKKLFILFASLLLAVVLSAEWTIVQTYPIPEGASGLAFDGTYLYCGIYGSNGDEFYRIDPATGSIQLQFANSNIGDCFGMTWDGTDLWITDHAVSANPAVAYELDINSGTILTQFNLPDHYMSGIAYDAGNFWVATYYPDPATIYQLDSSGNVLQQFTAPDNQPWDLCMENGNLWMADYWGDTLYKIDPTNGAMLESHASEDVDPAGIVWDGQYLWYCDNGASNATDYLYKVDLGGAGTPAISLGWDEYDFGNVTIGQPASVELPVTNSGAADLEISGLNFSLNDFSSDETLPITITPGGTANITIIFDPSVWGQFDCTLTITSNDPIHPAEAVSLTGYGVSADPSLVVFPTSLNYGAIRIGAFTGRYIEISNQGSGNLEISQLAIDENQFVVDETVTLPLNIVPTGTENIRIWFNPLSSGNITGTLTIHSNDPANPTFDIDLSGSGDDQQYVIGSILWQYDITAGYDNSPKAMAPIEDINGDGVGDLIVCSEDYYVRCFNGNASITGDVLWEYEIPSYVYQQNGLVVTADLNNDDFEDVVIGTAGGDRAVRAISGKTGELIWVFNTSIYGGTGGWVYQVDASRDFNNDGILDILASSGNDGSGTGPQRVHCLNGTNGNELWSFYVSGPKFSCIGIADLNNDGTPDVIGGGSNSGETEGKVYGINGATGSQLWEFSTGGSSVWALSEVDDFTGDGINDVAAGDFGGNYYGLNAVTGAMVWNGSIGNGLIIRFEKLNDVNGDGHPDIAIARSSQSNALVIDGYTGSNIWMQSIADQPWVVDKINDITGDGINDLVWGTLFSNNFGYFLDGASGNVISQTPLSSACDAIAGIPDINGDGSWEMVCGGRNGEVVCISGGETVGNGILEGNITLNGGTGNVAEATIQIGNVTITVDPTGYYNASVIAGTYDVTFILPTYETLTVEDVVIIEDQTVTLDATLNYCFAPQNL
ncbi:MAG TPA: choice-of-anchor D domain-containing protein, partial [Candidatus Cloacimonadota bacterium]|nr:choice-of-anchor D domain-containing protein [Candidatus Cloacimonadota bacterium]